jgi:hypothetical protein
MITVMIHFAKSVEFNVQAFSQVPVHHRTAVILKKLHKSDVYIRVNNIGSCFTEFLHNFRAELYAVLNSINNTTARFFHHIVNEYVVALNTVNMQTCSYINHLQTIISGHFTTESM